MKLSQDQLQALEEDLVSWIRKKMDEIGARQLVLGISGGKDSTVAAGIATRALGPENIYGLLMPDGQDDHLDDGIKACKDLGINYHILNIEETSRQSIGLIEATGLVMSKQARLNLAPRLRMTLMYAYAQSLEAGLVINTSNLSEDYIGYVTIYGDTAGAFAPFGAMTSDEVVQLGQHLELDKDLVLKTPEDGLTGQTDEEVFGFSYEVLNKYIRTGLIEDQETKDRIDRMHRTSRFKFEPVDVFKPGYLQD